MLGPFLPEERFTEDHDSVITLSEARRDLLQETALSRDDRIGVVPKLEKVTERLNQRSTKATLSFQA